MTRTSTFSARLDAEWSQLRCSRRTLTVVRSWSNGDADDRFDRLVGSIADLDEFIAATQRGVDGDEHVLLRLIEVAATEQLAGRILIQRLLPGLTARSRQYVADDDVIRPLDHVVASAWLMIRRYDTVRRRRHVAAALISDSVFHAFRQPMRRKSHAEVVVEPDTFDVVPHPEPQVSALEELAGVVSDARSLGVAACHLDLLRTLARAGSPAAVAAERKLSPRAIRYQRERAVAHVRMAIAA